MSDSQWQSAFYRSILDTSLAPYLGDFVAQFQAWEGRQNKKELLRFSKQIEQLPPVTEDIKVSIGSTVDIQSSLYLSSSEHIAKTRGVLKQFMPWRKGPFSLLGVDIDTEWRSDWKWDRILPHIGDLSGQRVLDVGCGSGYHLFRMHHKGASSVIGIDPTTLFFFQFHCFKRYLPGLAIHFLPIGIEHMPETKAFDSVFSMGVLYHRPDPIKFLRELRQQLKAGGQLVLETLVIEGDESTVLMPQDRYAQMRNVWFIPSVAALSLWLHRVGFKHVECVDLDITSVKEQRSTEWMQSQSLVDFLDPCDASKTLEGYSAPMRATIIAK